MVTIICQHTGIAFEAESKRQKNHPLVSRFLTECARDKRTPGAYGLAIDAFRIAKERGMTNIDDVMQFAESYVAENGDIKRRERQERQAAQAAAEKAMEERRRQAREERRQLNAFLREHGYVWHKEYASFDEYEEEAPTAWVLRSPDGRQTTIEQAKAEIERGVEVVLAEIAAQEKEAEERRLEAEAAAQQERERCEDAKAQVRALGEQCEPFDTADLPVIYELHDTSVSTHIVRVQLGEKNGKLYGVIYERLGSIEYENIEYWRAITGDDNMNTRINNESNSETIDSTWTMLANLAPMTASEHLLWRRKYNEHLSRLRRVYYTALAGNRVRLTKETTVTGDPLDLREIQDGKTVLIGWVDREGFFFPDSYSDDPDALADGLYRQGIDVIIEEVVDVVVDIDYDKVDRLREAYRLALAGNRVPLTDGSFVSGLESDLIYYDGHTVVVGRLDNGAFQQEGCYIHEDDFASAIYWREVDVA